MALPAANQPISFLDLQNEYGGSGPISLSEYFRSPNASNTKAVNFGFQGNWGYNSGFSNSGYSETNRHMVMDFSTKYGSELLAHQIRWVFNGAVVSNTLPAVKYSSSDFWANNGGQSYVLTVGSAPQSQLATKNYGRSPFTGMTGPPQYYRTETYSATGSKASQAGGTLFYYYYYSKTQTRSFVNYNSTVPISSTNNATISMSNFASQGN